VAIASRFSLDNWIGWFTSWTNALVPIQVVVGLAWGAQYPSTQSLAQPWRGMLLTIFYMMIGSIACLFCIEFVGGGSANPVVNVFEIGVVITTFFVVIAFGCWPFQTLSTPARGFISLIASYAITAILFRFCNFSAIPPLSAIAPAGPISFDIAVSFFFTMVVFLFAFVILDMWPLYKVPVIMKQPVLGIVLTILSAVFSYLAWVICVGKFHMLPLNMLFAFICYIAGILTVLLAFQGWPGRRLSQPANGIVNFIVSGFIAIVIYSFYRFFAAYHFGAGPAGSYPVNVFIFGNLLLGCTFPLYVVYGMFFDYWPLSPTVQPEPKAEGAIEAKEAVA
jgi:hypothetical protein